MARFRALDARQWAQRVSARGLRGGCRFPQILRPPADHHEPARGHPAYPGRQFGKLPSHPRQHPHLAAIARQGFVAEHRRGLAPPASHPGASLCAAHGADPGAPCRARRGRRGCRPQNVLRRPGRPACGDAISRPRNCRRLDVFARDGALRHRIARTDQTLRHQSRPPEDLGLFAAAGHSEPARCLALALPPPLAEPDPTDHRRSPRTRLGRGSARSVRLDGERERPGERRCVPARPAGRPGGDDDRCRS